MINLLPQCQDLPLADFAYSNRLAPLTVVLVLVHPHTFCLSRELKTAEWIK